MVAPLSYNPVLSAAVPSTPVAKKKRASLPFIDDFSYEGPYPDPSLWVDQQAFINNTFSGNPVTRGVATLDGLNQYGRPYLPYQYSVGLADSLTSVPIDLSAYSSLSNIYLSFYVQPQGLSFAPENGDSLFLYFRNSNNQWIRMWEQRGTPYQPFAFKSVPVLDPQFIHDSFQFRFNNIASLNLNDDVWNIDYVKLDANRNPADSLLNDVAFTLNPGSILKPYTAMPYRHFTVNQNNEKSAFQFSEIVNLYNNGQPVTEGHEAKELLSSTPISNMLFPSATIGAKSKLQQYIPSYPINYTAPGPQSKIVIRNTYYIQNLNPTDRKSNDTIKRDAIFDNYFAYDDGTAEKSYFLLPAFNYPSKTALQFHMNVADTIRGLSIHFGAQAPTAAGKYFSIVLYKQLGDGTLLDSVILQEDLFQVLYDSAVSGFTTYALAAPVALDTGKYYMGITQPANFGSDSLYYGLDVNDTTNSQFFYYNVDGAWYASTITGSIMMRPMVGQSFVPSAISEWSPATAMQVYPNPVTDKLYIQSEVRLSHYNLYNLQGSRILGGIFTGPSIDLKTLPSGIYFLQCVDTGGNAFIHKIQKN